jgi:hypothetical protein
MLAATCGALVTVVCLTLACSPRKSEPAAEAAVPMTWGGHLTSVVSVKEVMRDLIDPLADNIFNAVGADFTAKGLWEWTPRSDEDWAKVRVGAVAMAEASYLLKIPRSIEPAGWERIKRDQESGELPPPDVLNLISKNPVLWQAKIEALRNVGREVLEIVETRDASALPAAAEDLDTACEGCHTEFWYPNEKEFLRKVRQLEAARKHAPEIIGGYSGEPRKR